MSIATEAAAEPIQKIVFPTHLDLPPAPDYKPVAFPTHLDLPFTDNKPVDNTYQPAQAALLTGALLPRLEKEYPNGDFYIGANTGIYWRTTNPPENGCKAPDWFFVPGVPRLLDGQLRLSYVKWVEGVAAAVVMEFVSGSGAEERDATPFKGMFWVYERGIHADYYVIWDRLRERLKVYELIGHRYKPAKPDANGRFAIPPLGIAIGPWDGPFQCNPGPWLRAWDADGNMIPTAEERAEQQQAIAERERKQTRAERRRTREEKERADQEKHRADQAHKAAEREKQRADKLLARLRALGVDPDKP